MTESEFMRVLNEAYDKASKYDAKFGDRFDIRFLVSEAGIAALRHTELYATDNTFDGDHYLMGRKIIFVRDHYIPTYGMHANIIEPVIYCEDDYRFPMNASIGTYVIYANKLKQVIEVENDQYGVRTVKVKDIDASWHTGRASGIAIENFIYKRHKTYNQDQWAEHVDTSAITDYLSSLTIT